MIIAIIILSLVCLLLLVYLLLLKHQMQGLTSELRENRKEDYNKQLRVQLFDKDLDRLTTELNYNLDYQTGLKRKSIHQEQASRQAISDIAHDLRTPLTVVKGNLQLMEREGSLSEKDREYLCICRNQTEDLKRMVDEFFELSILESDDTSVELSEVNLTSLLLNVVLEHEILIRDKGLTPELNLPDKTLMVQGNVQYLERMFGNLLNNICKYATDTFSLSLKENSNTCIVEFANPIEDSTAIDVTKLFDRTYMADASRNKPGTGLGLYIVKLLATKQGAKVSAEIRDTQLVFIIEFKLN